MAYDDMMLDMIRRRNMFGGGQPLPQTTPFDRINFMPPPQPRQAAPVALVPPPVEGNSTAAYKRFLDTPDPRREDFAPSKMGRLTAALSGAAAGVRGLDGAGVARSVLDRPYNEALGQREIMGKRLSEAADVESRIGTDKFERDIKLRDMNVKEGTLASNDANRQSLIEARNRKAELEAAINAGKATDAMKQEWEVLKIKLRGETATDQIRTRGEEERITETLRQAGRAKIQETAIANRGTVIAVPGGNIMIVNPATGEVKDTGEPSGRYTEAELIEMRNEAALRLKTTPGPSTESTSTASDNAGNAITTTRTTKQTAPPRSNVSPAATVPTADTVILKDKNGKEWKVKKENVEAFKRANGL